MPEATKYPCNYLEMIDAAIRVEGPDDSHFDWIDAQCEDPADHQLVSTIEGLPGYHTDLLCCRHRTMMVDEVESGRVAGVELVADTVIGATIECRVSATWKGGQRQYVAHLVIVSGAGNRHSLPPARLHAATYEAALTEAQAQAARIVSHARGNDGEARS